ncbi:hypothetical protein V499_04078 [Pseudogymnoascus sp. VKM F-103]|nr:hypothetical protein V499_04078 [Pseudogymnoascus sp. VKM F-103]
MEYRHIPIEPTQAVNGTSIRTWGYSVNIAQLKPARTSLKSLMEPFETYDLQAPSLDVVARLPRVAAWIAASRWVQCLLCPSSLIGDYKAIQLHGPKCHKEKPAEGRS